MLLAWSLFWPNMWRNMEYNPAAYAPQPKPGRWLIGWKNGTLWAK